MDGDIMYTALLGGVILMTNLVLHLSEGRIIAYDVQPLSSEDSKLTNEALTSINARKAPLKESKSFGASGSDWILSYRGIPFDLSIMYILTLPLVLGKVAKVLCKQWRPVFSNADKQPLLPLIPLVILQASRAEREVKRQPRNGIQWFGETFLIHANADFIDIEDAANQAAEMDVEEQKDFIVDEDGPKKTWEKLRALIPFITWTRDTKKRGRYMKNGRPFPFGLESVQLSRENELRLQLHVAKQDKINDIYDLKDFYQLFRPKQNRRKRKKLMSNMKRTKSIHLPFIDEENEMSASEFEEGN